MRNITSVPMIWRALIALAVFFATAISASEVSHTLATAPPGSRIITISSYNAENLWDHNPSNTPDTWEEFLKRTPADRRTVYSRTLQYADYAADTSNWLTPTILRTKAKNFIDTITQLGAPDIVGLQELESAGNRSEVFDLPYGPRQTLRQKLVTMGYRYFILGQQNPENPVSVTTGFISKLPIKALPSIDVDFGTTTSCRDIQVAEVSLPTGRLVLFNSHWKSKNGGFEQTRIDTAHLLRLRIAEERRVDPRTDIIALGDFNASYHEKPMLELNTTGDEEEMLGRATSSLFNLWFTVPAKERWDYSFDGARNVLSHMVISDTLYDHQGLQYLENSYTTIGQTGTAAERMLGVDGRPYRWQVAKTSDQFATHIGQGYSDHLPLRASFIVHGNEAAREASDAAQKDPPRHIHREEVRTPPQQELLDHFDRCSLESALDIRELVPGEITNYLGRCVKIDLGTDLDPYPLHVGGPFASSYVVIPPGRDLRAGSSGLSLGLTMTRAMDWRPNIDDSRVKRREDTPLHLVRYSAKNFHPNSNKCYVRRVLQGPGGSLRRIVGKLSYNNGYLSIFAVTREENDLILENLPKNKRHQCAWIP